MSPWVSLKVHKLLIKSHPISSSMIIDYVVQLCCNATKGEHHILQTCMSKIIKTLWVPKTWDHVVYKLGNDRY